MLIIIDTLSSLPSIANIFQIVTFLAFSLLKIVAQALFSTFFLNIVLITINLNSILSFIMCLMAVKCHDFLIRVKWRSGWWFLWLSRLVRLFSLECKPMHDFVCVWSLWDLCNIAFQWSLWNRVDATWHTLLIILSLCVSK